MGYLMIIKIVLINIIFVTYVFGNNIKHLQVQMDAIKVSNALYFY
jgi:hypothetical protein